MSGAKTGISAVRTARWATFEYGDAIFVILNGEVTPADQKAEIMKKELPVGARACWMLPTRNGARYDACRPVYLQP